MYCVLYVRSESVRPSVFWYWLSSFAALIELMPIKMMDDDADQDGGTLLLVPPFRVSCFV